MNRNQLAQQHLLSLILGKDQTTGDSISLEDFLAEPEVIRSLVLAKEALTDARKPRSVKGEELPRAGKPWSPDEDEQLRSAFVAGASLIDLQSSHGRGDGGILSRLVRLGLVNSREEARAMFR